MRKADAAYCGEGHDPGGIDGFVFVPPMQHSNTLSLFQNEWKVEYKIVSFLCMRAGLTLYNPCDKIRMYHFHLSDFRPNQHDETRNLENELVGCPPSGDQPCCDPLGRVYIPEEPVPVPGAATIKLFGESQRLNHTVTDVVCLRLSTQGALIAPERGHERLRAYALGKQNTFFRVRPTPSHLTCLHDYLGDGHVDLIIEISTARGSVLTTERLSIFLFRHGVSEKAAACEWLKQDPRRKIGPTLRFKC